MNILFEHDDSTLAGVVEPAEGWARAALVFLHGSGPEVAEDWAEWTRELSSRGIVTLAYDKPGCGRSEGDWTTQSFVDRANEAVAAVRFLRSQPTVADLHVGVLGVSQGAWIGPHAAALSGDVAFVVAVSGSGVGPREQDRFRVEHQLRADGFAGEDVEQALRVWDDCDERFRRGDPDDALLAAIAPYRERPWFAYFVFADPQLISLGRLIWGYEPVEQLTRCACPLLGMWGAADTYVDAYGSREIYRRALAANHRVELLVVPDADHGLRNTHTGARPRDVYDTIAAWILQNVSVSAGVTA